MTKNPTKMGEKEKREGILQQYHKSVKDRNRDELREMFRMDVAGFKFILAQEKCSEWTWRILSLYWLKFLI